MSEKSDVLLGEILRWIRASSYGTIQQMFTREFRKGGDLDKVKAQIYQMSDGITTSVAIAKRAKVSQPQVSRLWKRWRQMGLAESSGESGQQTRRCFSLDDFGLEAEDNDKE